MINLPGHFEFLSDEWIEEAARFFELHQAMLGPSPFAVSGRFSDAPPHLKQPSDVASWSCRWDGQSTRVTQGFDDSADVKVEGDYQAALAGAQVIGLRSPGVLQARDREIAVMYGKGAVRTQGVLEPAAEDFMAAFHDHMARRTVENPDLEHRARRQGLSNKIREMEEQGYTVLENVISPEFAEELRNATLRSVYPQQLGPHSNAALNWLLYHGHEFERILQHPMLMTLVDASLGRGAVNASFNAITRGPGPGFIPVHTDYSHIPEPYPEFALTGVGVWALEDWSVESGPTYIVPGSHKLRRPPHEGETDDLEGVPVIMPKGSVVFFTHGVWHWQGDRTEPGQRVTLHAHYNRGILRGLEPKKLDSQMLHRNPPRLAELLGEHDWFDKMSERGREYGRYNYMNQLLAFTEAKKQEILSGRPANVRPLVKDLAALIKPGAARQARG